jgi:MFS family permease
MAAGTETITATAAVEARPASRSPLRTPHFRNLWLGSTVSYIGDQFYLVALPWLVLELTGSGLAVGSMLMVAAVPRAVLMLMGGAVTDRSAPRNILLATTWARTVLVGIVTLLAWLHWVQLWHLYVLSALFGTADAFAIPAGQALLPTLVEREQLTSANALFSGAIQASGLLGPAPAGVVIGAWGIAPAFLVDTVSFVFAIVPMTLLPAGYRQRRPSTGRPGMWQSIAQGIAYVWNDAALRSLVLIIAGLNLWAMGPITVGMPVLAKFKFGSSTAFGTMVSCFGAGALTGMMLAGLIRPKRRRGYFFLSFIFIESAGIVAMPFCDQLWVLAILMVLIGICGGIANVSMMAWIQGRVDHALMGRVMSVIMFAAVGLMPVSLALAGLVAERHATGMFTVAGILMMLTALVAGLSPATRHID